MVQLLQCLEVYSQVISHYTHASVAINLQKALWKSHSRLAELSLTYKFDSIREKNNAFITIHFLHGQDNPAACLSQDNRYYNPLLPNEPLGMNIQQYSDPASKSTSSEQSMYQNFDEGRCTRELAPALGLLNHLYTYRCASFIIAWNTKRSLVMCLQPTKIRHLDSKLDENESHME